ncbi:MAG: hypothetical protein JW857_00280 [Bacteroidales bacterium]|nr:hypothetical protein [Bacteroidales bacterium]
MYTALLHTHSGLRYLILALLLFTILKSIIGWFQKSSYGKLDDKLALFTMISIHIQLIAGIALYIVSPKVHLTDMSATMKNSLLRYFTVEHLLMMLIVVALVTIGRVASKKKVLDVQKHKTVAIYYGISLVLILVTVYVMMPS